MNNTLPPLPDMGVCKQCGTTFLNSEHAPFCSQACWDEVSLLPIYSPLEESKRAGRRYAARLEHQTLGSVGINWWPAATNPRQAIVELLAQLKLLPGPIADGLVPVLWQGLHQIMYEGLKREAEKGDGRHPDCREGG